MAVSSLGKTTFCSQMADQIAEQGNDVLFFSMEMSRLEMVTKSINRYAAKENPQSGLNGLKIRRNQMTAEQRELAASAAQAYTAAVGDRVSIIEGDFNCNIPFIGNYIRQYIERNNVRPVVFIDYLQIIEPGEHKGSKQQIKDTMDEAVKLFKQLTRKLSVPIVVISSVNRASYLSPLDLESQKESGGIEYTADVVLGLQLQIMHDSIFEDEKKIGEKRRLVKEAKKENPRKVELVCLKNRYGPLDIHCNLLYYPALDLYQEEDAAPFETRRPAKR
jgi:replicative DNA helicase